MSGSEVRVTREECGGEKDTAMSFAQTGVHGGVDWSAYDDALVGAWAADAMARKRAHAVYGDATEAPDKEDELVLAEWRRRCALKDSGTDQVHHVTVALCPGGRRCTCPPAPTHGCCLLHFPDDPCEDCPAADPELEEHCADCGIGALEADLADFPRHGGNVLLCGPCYADARAEMPEEHRDVR